MWPIACFESFVQTGSGGDFQVSELGKEPVNIQLSDKEFKHVTFAVRGTDKRRMRGNPPMPTRLEIIKAALVSSKYRIDRVLVSDGVRDVIAGPAGFLIPQEVPPPSGL